MVCLGNICRSPLAEGILQSKVNSNVFVDSAGTASYHIGKSPDYRSVGVAKKHSISIENQRCKHFTSTFFDAYDYIYVMDLANYKDVIALARTQKDKQKVRLILNELHPNQNLEVPDPYYGNEADFEHVFELLDKACDVISKKIK